MSVDPEAKPVPIKEDAAAALIGERGLSQEQVALIQKVMGLEELGFSEAAVRLGLLSAQDVSALSDRKRSEAASPSIIESALRRASVGQVATVPPPIYFKPSKELLLVHNPAHPQCERLRALRTELMLLLGEPTREASVLAVLSPGPGEGRSRLCAELAVAFSQRELSTLLVEADLRKPRQHSMFGIDNASGLSSCLLQGSAPQPLRIEGLPHLSVLTAGAVPPNPLELLSNGRFDRLILEWRRRYDMIVIDTPALTQFADGLAIASLAQYVLLVSRANTTRHKDMKDSLRRLATTNARIVGAVINDF